MTQDILTVFLLLGACILAFIVNRPRMDAVALLALLALVLTGILTVDEALAGFSEPSVVLIAAFFVIGEALVRTGVAYRVGDWLVRRAGNSEPRLLVLLMLAVAGLGSVMSSTGVVAIFIPVTLGIASRIGVPPGRGGAAPAHRHVRVCLAGQGARPIDLRPGCVRYQAVLLCGGPPRICVCFRIARAAAPLARQTRTQLAAGL